MRSGYSCSSLEYSCEYPSLPSLLQRSLLYNSHPSLPYPSVYISVSISAFPFSASENHTNTLRIEFNREREIEAINKKGMDLSPEKRREATIQQWRELICWIVVDVYMQSIKWKKEGFFVGGKTWCNLMFKSNLQSVVYGCYFRYFAHNTLRFRFPSFDSVLHMNMIYHPFLFYIL